MTTIETKLKDFIKNKLEYAEKNGYTKFSTCSHRNWDRDVWIYHQEIINSIKKRGYKVSAEVNWGVLDVTIKKRLNL